MSTRVVRTSMRLRRREQEQQLSDVNETQNPNQQNQQVTEQAPVVLPVAPPTIDLDATDDDDDVVESTASAFAQAKNNSSGRRRGGRVVVDVESGSTTRSSKDRSKRSSDRASVESAELKKKRTAKAKAVVEEPKFNCPICMCPFTEETSTKCGHIFCNSCIKKAIAHQANCPTCRKKVARKDLIRIFLPSTR